MQKKIPFLLALTLLLAAAKKSNSDLVRFTVINESPFPLGISLTGTFTEAIYYLNVPAGDQEFPVERTFTITRDEYQMQVYYIDLWDPVYGYTCSTGPGGLLNAMRNSMITVKHCRAATAGGSHSRTDIPVSSPITAEVESPVSIYRNRLYSLN